MGLRPGQLDPQTSEIGHRMRELAGRKAYLRNFWYAAGECIRYPTPTGPGCAARLALIHVLLQHCLLHGTQFLSVAAGDITVGQCNDKD